jgi:hypothetical protein
MYSATAFGMEVQTTDTMVVYLYFVNVISMEVIRGCYQSLEIFSNSLLANLNPKVLQISCDNFVTDVLKYSTNITLTSLLSE